MAVLLGGIGALNARNIINMGIVRKEKNGNRVAISYDMGQYDVRGFYEGQHFWESFDKFADAKKFFNSMYKKF